MCALCVCYFTCLYSCLFKSLCVIARVVSEPLLSHKWYQSLHYHTTHETSAGILKKETVECVCVRERERERERWTRREEGSQKKSKGFKFKARDSNLCLTQCQISNLTDIGIWRQVKEEDCNVRKRRRMIFFPSVFFFFFFLG